eukprot:g15981.t1
MNIFMTQQDEAGERPEVRFTVVASRPPLEATASRRSLPGAVIRISQARLAEFFEQPSDVSFGSSGAQVLGAKMLAGDFTDHDWREVELPAFPELREFARRVAEHAACPSCNGVASDTVENYRHRFLGENSGHSVWEKRLDMGGAPALAAFGGARKWVPQLMGDRHTGAVVGFYVRRTEAEATTAGETDSDRSRSADGAAVAPDSSTFSLVLKMRLRGIIPDSEEPMRVRSEDETARRNNDAYYTSDGLLSPLDGLEPYDPRTPADVDALHVNANMPQGQEVEPDSGSDTDADSDADSGAGADFLEQEDEWTVGRRSVMLHVEFRKAVASVSMEAEEAAEEEILAPYGYAILRAGVRGRERVFELQRGLFHSFV